LSKDTAALLPLGGAGEKEFELEKYTRANGVPVVPNLQKDLKVMQQELKLTQYNFPF
jgi:hypothetical protein